MLPFLVSLFRVTGTRRVHGRGNKSRGIRREKETMARTGSAVVRVAASRDAARLVRAMDQKASRKRGLSVLCCFGSSACVGCGGCGGSCAFGLLGAKGPAGRAGPSSVASLRSELGPAASSAVAATGGAAVSGSCFSAIFGKPRGKQNEDGKGLNVRLGAGKKKKEVLGLQLKHQISQRRCPREAYDVYSEGARRAGRTQAVAQKNHSRKPLPRW
jgi:Fe-S-cluster-containing hydrogenase component 2